MQTSKNTFLYVSVFIKFKCNNLNINVYISFNLNISEVIFIHIIFYVILFKLAILFNMFKI